MEALLIAIASLVFAAVGYLAGRALQRQAEAAAVQAARAGLEAELASLKATRAAEQRAAAEWLATRQGELAAEKGTTEQLRRQVGTLQQEAARLQAELAAGQKAAEGRAAEAQQASEHLRTELELLGKKLLEAQGKAMLDRSKEGLEALLGPLGERLKEFAAKVDKTHETDLRDRTTLLGELAKLQAAQTRLHADADNLTRALSGQSKVQGDWGELILEKVLETAGLTEGREYDLQKNHQNEAGQLRRPDALVYLPDNRAIVVDAKCSLVAFLAANAATDDAAREAALDAHAASVRGHVAGLARKKYQDVLEERTLDVVFLFVPNEAAFQAALTHDGALYTDAFREGVILCSPTTLLAALQLVAHVWRTERQGQNAQKIAEEAGALLEKFEGFVADLTAIGSRLEQANDAYQDARKKLDTGNGNLVRRARKLMTLGARVKTPKVKALLASAGEEGEDEEAAEVEPGVEGG